MQDGNYYYKPSIVGKMDNVYWLRHLSHKVVENAFGDKLCGFTIALEAWRRGLTVTVNSQRASQFQSYVISSAHNSIQFNRARIASLTAKRAIAVLNNKYTTKESLLKEGVPTPLGKKFNFNDPYESVIDFVRLIGWPVVIKPLVGSLGRGVYTNINNDDDLLVYCKYIIEKLNVKNYLIEKYVVGEDYRILANNEKIFAAAKRIPANIVGNGVDSIMKLISVKNAARRKNPNYYNRMIKIDNEVEYYVKNKGYDFDSVLPKDLVLYLRGKANTSSGGDLIDVTDDITPDIAHAAIKAIKAIDGLEFGGVDLLYDSNTGDFSIIEVNSRPQIGHMYPTSGLGRDIPRMLIDTYFPEAPVRHEDINPHFVFDVNKILSPLVSGVAGSITVAPKKNFKNFVRRRYLLKGSLSISDNKLSSRLLAIAKKHNVFGSVGKDKEGRLLFCLGGDKLTVSYFINEVCEILSCIKESSKIWKGVIKQSFIVNF